MGNSFDISVERLAGAGVPAPQVRPASEGGPYNGEGRTAGLDPAPTGEETSRGR